MFTQAMAVPGSGVSLWVYAAFVCFVLVMLALDLGVFHRKAHAPSMREALGWTAVWVTVALVFGGAVYWLYDTHTLGLGQNVPVIGKAGETVVVGGFEATKLYLTAYLIEKSLSMDNVFVIAMIFTAFGIPQMYQHRVLFWGILGALIMRGVMIGIGAAVVAKVSWIVYVFGGLLIFSALKMALSKDEEHDPSKSRVIALISRVIPISKELEGQRLVSHIGGRWHGTPLLAALIIVEMTDLMFAVDSIPAVFAITGDPFIVFTSNIMAILGLRSLYFCLASAMTHFRFLKTALIAVLLFVGIKMCLMHTAWKVPTEISLAVVVGLLVSGIAASLLAGAAGSPETPTGEGIIPEAVRKPGEGERHGWRWALAVWRSSRTLRRVSVLTAGSVVIAVGVIISPLPGPGLTILGPIGLGIIASEFVWARRMVVHIARHERGLRGVLDRIFAGISRLWIVPVVFAFWLTAWLLSGVVAEDRAWLVWAVAFPAFTPACYVLYRWYMAHQAVSADEGENEGVLAASQASVRRVSDIPEATHAPATPDNDADTAVSVPGPNEV